jgi:hypothetical protein
MIRRCDSCGLRLPGRRGHGFVRDGKLVCGKREREMSVLLSDGSLSLLVVPTPGCARW